MARVSDMSGAGRRSLTAAVAAVTPSQIQRLHGITGHEYWRYYRELPDIRYLANLSGRLLSLSMPGLQRLDEKVGVWRSVDDPPPQAIGAQETLHESPGGLEDISRRFAQQFVVDGESRLIGYNNVDGHLEVEALSKVELQSNGGQWIRADPLANGATYNVPPGARVYRVWRRHPEVAIRAETALEALVDDMETLIFLNSALRARVRSRLAAAGVLYLPNSLVMAGPAQRPDGTGNDTDPVTKAIIEAMSKAITDPDSAEAAMPIVIRGPDEAGQNIRHVTLDRLIDEQEMNLRKELRDNILQGLDAPQALAADNTAPNTNHWNAASIKMEMWEHTVAPIGDVMWEGLTRMVLRPFLEAKGVEGTYRWRVDRDSVQIRNNQDEKTRVAYDRDLISDNAARRRLGIPDTDAPSDEEVIRAVGRRMGLPEAAFYGLETGDLDLANLKPSARGPQPSGDGRTIPADTVGDEPDDRDRRVR